MTIKELRVSNGLSQSECAKFLGMSTRNYQNYENDPSKTNTAKYNAIYQKLEKYGVIVPTVDLVGTANEFHTNVVAGANLKVLTRIVSKYKKRDCFKLLKKFITKDIADKIIHQRYFVDENILVSVFVQ